MNFYQLAIKNVSRNLRSYLAFYLSSSFAVMIFYIFAMFIFHPALEEGFINTVARKGMTAAEWVIFVFSILFVLYSVSAFLHTRKREFGILTISGTSPKQMRLLLTAENMFIGLASIVTGIVGGTILAKMFYAAGGYILEMETLRLYFPWKAIGITTGVFLLLFFIISQFILFFINSEATVALLKGSKTPKKEPKPSILLSLLSFILLGIGYGMVLKAEINMSTALIIFIVIVIGTYFFFSQLSIWLLKLMKKNKRFYLKGYHLLTISDLTYRVKDNARLFFIVSIVSAVAFTATGVLAVFKSSMTVESTEYEIEYLSLPENTTESDHIRLIEDSLSESGYDYTTQTFETIDARYKSAEGLTPRVVILSQENLSKSFPHVEVEPLEDNVGIYFLDNHGFQSKADIPRSIKLVDSPNTITVKRIENSILSVATALVVNDQTFEKIKNTLKTSTFHGFHYKNWKDSTEISRVLESQIFGDYSNVEFYLSTKANVYFQTVQLPSLSLFIGLFVAIVFFFAAGSFLYFRLFTDLEDEREKYKALAKIGLTEKEMKRSATWQLGILFFLPFIVATTHTAFAMKVVEREVLFDIFTPTIITIIGFLLLQTLFFIIVRLSYLKKLTASIHD